MVTRTRYTDDDRIAALAALQANNGNVKRTAEELDIPRVTLIDWRDAAGDAIEQYPLGPSRMEQYADMWGEAQRLAVARMIELLPTATSIRDVTIAAGIAADKHLDYSIGRKGTQTQVNVDARTQSLTIGADLDDDARRAILARVITSE